MVWRRGCGGWRGEASGADGCVIAAAAAAAGQGHAAGTVGCGCMCVGGGGRAGKGHVHPAVAARAADGTKLAGAQSSLRLRVRPQ